MLEPAAQDRNLCGEAPMWDPSARRLLWVDLGSSLVYELVPSTPRPTRASSLDRIRLNVHGRPDHRAAFSV